MGSQFLGAVGGCCSTPCIRACNCLSASLNRVYRKNRALHEVDFEYSGFEWIDFSDVEKSIIVFMRRAEAPGDDLIVACNFTAGAAHGLPGRGSGKGLLPGNSQQRCRDVRWQQHGQRRGGAGRGRGLRNTGTLTAFRLRCRPLAVVVFQKADLMAGPGKWNKAGRYDCIVIGGGQ